MRKYIEIEMEIYFLQTDDIVRTSYMGGVEGENDSTDPGTSGATELPFVPF